MLALFIVDSDHHERHQMVAHTDSSSINEAPPIDVSKWARVGETKLSDNAMHLFEWFVLGTPAIGLSKRSAGFIRGAHIHTTLDAEALFNVLNDQPSFIRIFDSSAALRTEVAKLEQQKTDFWVDGEQVFMVKGDSNSATDEIKKLPEYERAKSSPLKQEQTKIVVQRFLNIDTLFRHMRNALAHGCYFEFEMSDQPAFFLFDINQYKELSAVFSITFSRLQLWHNHLERLTHAERAESNAA